MLEEISQQIAFMKDRADGAPRQKQLQDLSSTLNSTCQDKKQLIKLAQSNQLYSTIIKVGLQEEWSQEDMLKVIDDMLAFYTRSKTEGLNQLLAKSQAFMGKPVLLNRFIE